MNRHKTPTIINSTGINYTDVISTSSKLFILRMLMALMMMPKLVLRGLGGNWKIEWMLKYSYKCVIKLLKAERKRK